MASEIKLPELGENLTSGEVLDVKVAAGDTVSQGQTLLEVEAEKSTVEVPSPIAGQVTQLLVKKGQTIEVGQTLCLIEEGQEAKDGGEEKKGHKTLAAKADGKQGPVAETEREPAKTAKHAEESVQPEKEEKKGHKTPAEKADGKQGPAPADKVQEERATPDQLEEETEPPGDGRRRGGEEPAERLVSAGPATRRLARELGVDLGQVHGSAPGGRVTQDDIKAYVRELASAPAVPRSQTGVWERDVGAQPALPDFSRWGEVERHTLEGVRRKTAEQVSLAWSLIPHVTQHDQADVTDLDAFRKQQDERGPKLTITAFALKAVAIALQQFPQFSSSLDPAAGQLILKHYYHVGVAIDTERGLLVPVLRNVDKKSVQELAAELADVAERARQKKLPVEEMRGGCFTITNLGGIGGTAFTPIINYPEVAILGLSRSRLEPVVREGQVVPRLMLPLSLSYDHRVIDGADAARFTRRIAELLEHPLLMLLQA